MNFSVFSLKVHNLDFWWTIISAAHFSNKTISFMEIHGIASFENKTLTVISALESKTNDFHKQ